MKGNDEELGGRRFKDAKLGEAFGESLKNPYSEFDSKDNGAESIALKEAIRLHYFMNTERLSKTETKGVVVTTKSGDFQFQSTVFLFFDDTGKKCKASVSVPISFRGGIRIWAEDFTGRKVWSTMNKIIECECNPDMLFDFLGKYTDRYTVEQMDHDLPF